MAAHKPLNWRENPRARPPSQASSLNLVMWVNLAEPPEGPAFRRAIGLPKGRRKGARAQPREAGVELVRRKFQGSQSLSVVMASSRQSTQSFSRYSGWFRIHPISFDVTSAAGSCMMHRSKNPPSTRNLT